MTTQNSNGIPSAGGIHTIFWKDTLSLLHHGCSLELVVVSQAQLFLLFIAQWWRMRFFRITGSEFKFWPHSVVWGKCPDPWEPQFPVLWETFLLPPRGLGGINRCGVSPGPDTKEALGQGGLFRDVSVSFG